MTIKQRVLGLWSRFSKVLCAVKFWMTTSLWKPGRPFCSVLEKTGSKITTPTKIHCHLGNLKACWPTRQSLILVLVVILKSSRYVLFLEKFSVVWSFHLLELGTIPSAINCDGVDRSLGYSEWNWPELDNEFGSAAASCVWAEWSHCIATWQWCSNQKARRIRWRQNHAKLC